MTKKDRCSIDYMQRSFLGVMVCNRYCVRLYGIPYSIEEDSCDYKSTDTDQQVLNRTLPRVITKYSLTNYLHVISRFPRRGENTPRPLHVFFRKAMRCSGRPGVPGPRS